MEKVDASNVLPRAITHEIFCCKEEFPAGSLHVFPPFME